MGGSDKFTGGLERRKTSKYWYGRFQIDGKRKVKNLYVEMRGTPPGVTEEHGSVQFEKSKSEADAALKSMLAEINGSKTAEQLKEAVYEVRMGHSLHNYMLTDLPSLWEKSPRKKNKTFSDSHQKISIAWLEKFIAWMGERYPDTIRTRDVMEAHAREYMAWQKERGVSPRTHNAILKTLRFVFSAADNPVFGKVSVEEESTVHRIPFTPEELKEVIQAARADDLIYPLVVTAACTAMRKGDCCRLYWEQVDLEKGYITVKTSKTKVTVDIPLADLLRVEIEKQAGRRKKLVSPKQGSKQMDYVFPKLARQYISNPDLLTKRFKKVLARVGFHDGTAPLAELAPYDPAELAAKAETYFSEIPTDQKRGKARAMFETYTGGKALYQSAEAVGISKTTGSAYLNEIEAATGIAFIRGKKRDTEALPPCRGDVRLERETGLRRASVRDFHALRTTWITLALMQGLPMELVRKISGHATAEVVMKHYLAPQREQLKTALQKHLPAMLTSGAEPVRETPAERAAELLRTMTAKNWEKVKQGALTILEDATA